MTYTGKLAVARLLYLLTDKRLRARYCACRRPVETEIDNEILKAMDDVEKALASE